ncbi:MAG: ferredoxin [Bacilli bacterium]|nr:ferredoxin [Bacilli bacterium]
MKAKVLDNLCIGCGACASLVPEEFDFNDDGYAYALNEQVKEENKELVEEAKGNCPTGAITVEE